MPRFRIKLILLLPLKFSRYRGLNQHPMENILTLNLDTASANKLIALLNFAIKHGEYPVAVEACPFISELLRQDREFKEKNPPVQIQTAE